MLYILATAALAALANTAWRLYHGGWDMPPWLMAVIILGSAAAVEAAERALEVLRARRARAGRPRRRAHARPTTNTRRAA